MSLQLTQSTTSASAASKRRLITPESAILRCDAGTVMWPDATTPNEPAEEWHIDPRHLGYLMRPDRMATKKSVYMSILGR